MLPRREAVPSWGRAGLLWDLGTARHDGPAPDGFFIRGSLEEEEEGGEGGGHGRCTQTCCPFSLSYVYTCLCKSTETCMCVCVCGHLCWALVLEPSPSGMSRLTGLLLFLSLLS